ncbi:hypothetical protein KDA03_19630 [Proteus mirabilis]
MSMNSLSEKTWGRELTSHQYYRCQGCYRNLQLDYEYRAWLLGTKDKIINLTNK